MTLVYQNTATIKAKNDASIAPTSPITAKRIRSIPLFDNIRAAAAKSTHQTTESSSNGASIISIIQIPQSQKSCSFRCYRRQTTAHTIDGILMKMRSPINRISIEDEATAIVSTKSESNVEGDGSIQLQQQQQQQQQMCCRRRRHESTNKKSSIILMKIHLALLIIALLTATSSARATVAASASASTASDSTTATTKTTTAHTMKYSSNVVRTKYGELRGIVVRNNPTVEAYLGVPYATPPVGSLR